MESPGYFITGTDTGVGKTWFSVLLIEQLIAAGKNVVGMKPVASGCQRTAEGLRNEDALQLIAASNVRLPYEDINPYAFEPAIAPHLAADQEQTIIDLDRILPAFQRCCDAGDSVVVEGVGGWLVPLNKQQTIADLAKLLQLPVILVVGIRLGCINHALLTVQSMASQGLVFHGWVANRVDPHCEKVESQIADLKQRIDAPLLLDLGWGQTGGQGAGVVC
ncbi:MAG: dethiobiotin synthase [Gammaproteobacteria bacterium]